MKNFWMVLGILTTVGCKSVSYSDLQQVTPQTLDSLADANVTRLVAKHADDIVVEQKEKSGFKSSLKVRVDDGASAYAGKEKVGFWEALGATFYLDLEIYKILWNQQFGEKFSEITIEDRNGLLKDIKIGTGLKAVDLCFMTGGPVTPTKTKGALLVGIQTNSGQVLYDQNIRKQCAGETRFYFSSDGNLCRARCDKKGQCNLAVQGLSLADLEMYVFDDGPLKNHRVDFYNLLRQFEDLKGTDGFISGSQLQKKLVGHNAEILRVMQKEIFDRLFLERGFADAESCLVNEPWVQLISAAKTRLNENLVNKGKLPLGSALITSSGNLSERGIKTIIHAGSGSMYEPRTKGFKATTESIVNSISNSILLAKRHNYPCLAVPFVGGGIFLNDSDGNVQKTKSDLIKASFLGASQAADGQIKVKFVAYGAEDQEIFGQVFQETENQLRGVSVVNGSILKHALHSCPSIVNAANIEYQFGGGLSGYIGGQTGQAGAIDSEAAVIMQAYLDNLRRSLEAIKN